MNSFSDLLATDPKILLRICVRPIYGSRPPNIEIRLNHKVSYRGLLTQNWNLTTDLSLLDPLTFEVELLEKVYDPQDETAAVVHQLDIDDFELIPNFTHLIQYHNDHGFCGPTAHVGFVGTWCLDISEPFYRWHHRVTGQGWLLEPAAV